MGRLTLNVLLSFAQFERELSSERVRDKVAASRRKGKWTGGGIALGYDVVDKKLTINPTEAVTVRTIFQRYSELKCLRLLKDDLDSQGIVSKRRKTRKGNQTGGIRLTYGPLAHLLKNRIYLGEIGHNGEWFAAEHEPIVDEATFDQVQETMKANSVARRQKRAENDTLLAGLLYDDRGNRMTPSFTTKRDVRYRFYVSAALLKGHKKEAGSLPRISGPHLEAAVLAALRSKEGLLSPQETLDDREVIDRFVERVEVSKSNIRLILKKSKRNSGSPVGVLSEAHEQETCDVTSCIDMEWRRNSGGPPACIEESQEGGREPDPTLVHAIARAQLWVKLLIDGAHNSIECLAASVNMHPKVVRKGIQLAFLAPNIVEAILLGHHSKSAMTLARLHGAYSVSWIEQMRQSKMSA